MLSGVKDASATFQRVLIVILVSFKWQFAHVRQNKIVVVSRTPQDRTCHTCTAVRLSKDTGATLKLKCAFFTNQINHLVHVVRPLRYEAANHITDAINSLRTTKAVQKLHSFLRLCHALQSFVTKFVRIALLLSERLKNTSYWELDR